MKHPTRYSMMVVAVAVVLGLWVLAAGKVALTGDKSLLPRQTNTHFFEVYHCGRLAGVLWVTPDEAALYRVQNLGNPQLRRIALDFRAEAREQGTAFAVHGTKGGCVDA